MVKKTPTKKPVYESGDGDDEEVVDAKTENDGDKENLNVESDDEA